MDERWAALNSVFRAAAPATPLRRRPGALNCWSSSSPVAIRATATAQPITSAGRRWPCGPRGISHTSDPHVTSCAWT